MIAYVVELINPRTRLGPRSIHTAPTDVFVAPAIREWYKKGEREFYIHCAIYNRSKLIESNTLMLTMDDGFSDSRLMKIVTRWTLCDMRASKIDHHRLTKDS